MKTLLTIVTLLSFGFASFATPVLIKFEVVDSVGNTIPNTVVNVYAGNQKIETQRSRSGKFKLEVESTDYYTLEIISENCVSKLIVFDARADEKLLWDNVYALAVEMEKAQELQSIPNADYFLDYPSAIVSFDEELGVYKFSATYSESSKQHREDIFASIR